MATVPRYITLLHTIIPVLAFSVPKNEPINISKIPATLSKTNSRTRFFSNRGASTMRSVGPFSILPSCFLQLTEPVIKIKKTGRTQRSTPAGPHLTKFKNKLMEVLHGGCAFFGDPRRDKPAS
jgi:hypothetical protein